MQDLPKAYNPKEVEEKWLKIWLSQKLFKSEIDPNKEGFSIALPPPNVTGNLHMGHAFGDTIQDVLIRYHKMNGKNVLWQGGTDHAGIATQVLVERDISKKEKKRKEDLGREEFLKRVWVWKEKHGNEIIDQMKKLGCFMDYDRLVFTMDENYSKAIRKVFVELYKKGLIYRGKRIVNWCPKCLTSLSDLEVETEHITGKLYHILYPFDIKDISKGGVTVATTRPETMFGDVAVCVNPEDVRYKKFVGAKVTLPIINKMIPIISDEAIKMDFGTGAVKTTPAHDANDYEIFERHKKDLKEYPETMSPSGKIQDKNNLGIPQDILNLDRFKARELTIQKLEELGLLKQVTEYEQSQEKHDRCSTILEPYLSEQWYVKMKPLSEPAIKAVEEGKIKFVPERYQDHYLNWLRNIKDWCISRQLWWGHQIPVWYRNETAMGRDGETAMGQIGETARRRTGESARRRDGGGANGDIYVGEEPPKDIENYIQDPDVLDTWFSSALWPFVTLGWPLENETAMGRDGNGAKNYFEAFYPTSVLATAREIINLWVSRMVFMGLEFTGEIPFKEVIIHPIIQTPDGKRMSKSKGNAIDPLEMIDKYGADANRFWYFSLGVTGNQDVRFSGRKDKDGKWESDILEQYKRFANKLWNASRFVLQNLEEGKEYEADLRKGLINQTLTVADHWILYQYKSLIQSVSNGFSNYELSDIARNIYKFIWDDFCDWYIEISKRQLSDPSLSEQTKLILIGIISNVTRALHPIMPFITEEIWHSLPLNNKGKFICLEKYPKPDKSFIENSQLAKSFSHVIDTTREIRNQRQVLGIPWTKEIEVRLFTKEDFEKKALESSINYIESLTKSKSLILSEFNPIKPSTGALVTGTRIQIPLSGLVDLDNMLSSLNKKKNQFEKELESQKTKLNNTNFINNAAQDKIDEVKARALELENQIKTIDEQISLLK